MTKEITEKKYPKDEYGHLENPIKKARTKAGLSRKRACEIFQIPYRTWVDWENGNCKPYIANLVIEKLEKMKKEDKKMSQKRKKMMRLAGEWEEKHPSLFFADDDRFVMLGSRDPFEEKGRYYIHFCNTYKIYESFNNMDEAIAFFEADEPIFHGE